MSSFLMSHVLRIHEGNAEKPLHRFGGKPIHSVTNQAMKKCHLHCLYIFDLQDLKMPQLLDNSRWLPLYYPLYNNACDFSYQVLSEHEIFIHHLGDSSTDENFPYDNYPPILPERQIATEPLTYDQQKTLIFSFLAEEYGVVSDSDTQIVQNLQYPFTQIGGIQEMVQGFPEDILCPNKKCTYREYSNMEVFAVVWNRPISDFCIWGDTMDDCQLIFQICPMCKTIHVCNRCG
ncbi:hypothetical protein [Desulfogranum japonicum]|uniref:hypothetical protein n=1 Tax=Desulfogranum japonicum TaxID=231447 RepID=UPI0004022E83|nr:hypothetical protein [Desulfogranum japonicum]